MRRAVITGIGPLTPIGCGKAAFAAGLKAGCSAVRRLTAFDPAPFRSQIAGEVSDFNPADHFEPKALKRLDRFSQFSLVASRLAVRDAGLELAKEDRERVGICLGTALGGVAFAEQQVSVFLTRGLREVETLLACAVFGGAGSCNVAIDLGISGPATANANSCASGTVALGEALGWIRGGQADVVLAGGAETPLAPLCYGAFALIRAMSTRNDDPAHACRPFDAGRDGFVMAEGAAMLVVEELAHAHARGAHIYAEIIGYALTNDGYHIVTPLPDGAQAARCIRLALDSAGVAPDEVDYINAHGSSTPLNDRAETLAIKRIFGEETRIPVSSTKGLHAHALGATGAIEAAACAVMMDDGFLAPTLNYATPDPACDLDYVPNHWRAQPVRTVLSNSFGFGGINACLVLRTVDG